MADIKKAMQILFEVEFNSMPQRFLHKNKTEELLTIGGVYQKANPYNVDWHFINEILEICDNQITRASTMLYYDKQIQDQVQTVFLNNYWNRLNLSNINSQLIANEIFLMSVVAGTKNGGKLAQKLVGVEEDGIIGKKSIEAFNGTSELYFSQMYDNLEIKYFENLVANNEKLEIYLDGWKNRALTV